MKKIFALVLWLVLIAVTVLLSRSAPPAGGNPALLFMGDVMLGRDIARAHTTSATWDDTFALLTERYPSSWLFANLESPICETPACDQALSELPSQFQSANSGINLCAPSGAWQAFEPLEKVILTTANNHRDDCRPFEDSLPVGIRQPGENSVLADDTGAVYMPYAGQTLALLAGDDISAPIALEQLLESVRIADKQADWVIVSLHWGSEYQASPNQRQRQIATQLVVAGADILWGHHPHVWQAPDWLVKPDGGQALVLYSMGNAMFDQGWPKPLQSAGVAEVCLTREGEIELKNGVFRIDSQRGRLVADESASP